MISTQILSQFPKILIRTFYLPHKISLCVHITLYLSHAVARQNRNARALLAKVTLGARLQTHLAAHILKSTDHREEIRLHIIKYNIRNQKDSHKDSQSRCSITTCHFLFYARKLSITVDCCEAVGRTGRPVLRGKAGGFVPTHQPFRQPFPEAHDGSPRPQRGALGSPMNPSRRATKKLSRMTNKKVRNPQTKLYLSISNIAYEQQ